jgi:ribosomal protein L12E/L44/L45/RPP1/RPP2
MFIGAAPAGAPAGGAIAAAPKEEKKKEEEAADVDMGGLFGDDY